MKSMKGSILKKVRNLTVFFRTNYRHGGCMMDKGFFEDISVLHQFIRNFHKSCNPVEMKVDLNRTQAHVLMAVAKNNVNTMTKISEEVGLEKGSFTTVVDSLIQKGYLERIRSEEDRRKISLVLTTEGREVATMMQQHMGNQAGKMFHTTNKEDLEAIKQAVHVLAEFARKVEG